MPAFTSLMIDDACLGLEEPFHLEQARRAACFVQRLRQAEHDPLDAETIDPVEFPIEMVATAADHLIEHVDVERRTLTKMVAA